jgi:hypothetical protein
LDHPRRAGGRHRKPARAGRTPGGAPGAIRVGIAGGLPGGRGPVTFPGSLGVAIVGAALILVAMRTASRV